MLTVKTLGTPRVLLDGKPVALPFKRAEALLYYLAVERSASRQELIALLWESDDEAKGRKNLRHALYTLNKELGGEVLLSPQKSVVVLNTQREIDCDYDRFVRGEEEEAYQGSFLSGFGVKNAFSLDEWILRTREKLRNLHLSRMEQRSRALLAAGDPEGACKIAVEYLNEEPFDESMAVFLMDCYQERHQYTRASQVYQALKEQLSRELGVDPLETTTIKYYEILNQWNDAAGQPDDSGDHMVPVGREKIYDTLRAATLAFTETATRRSSQLLLGESGSGKSEVINFFLRTGALRELLVIRTECLQSKRETPFALWREITGQLLEFARQANLLIPEVLQEGFPPYVMPDQALEDALVLLLSRVGRKKKILLILEDLQSADQWSVELLASLLRRLERGTMMAILSMTWGCSQQTMEVLEHLEADEMLHRQVLLPLSRQNTDAILRRELGDEVADRLGDWLYQESGGNLRLLSDLVQTYERTGDVRSAMESLNEFLLNRLRGLTQDALHLTHLLCLSSGGVSVQALQELMGMDTRRLSEILLVLRQRAIAEEFFSDNANCCRFLHPKLRELVYGQLTAYQRQELHGRMAEALSHSTPDPSDLLCWEISWHYEKVGQLEKSLDYELMALEKESRWRCTGFVPWPQGREIPVDALEKAVKSAQDRLSLLQRAGKRLTSFSARLNLIRGRIALFRGDQPQAVALLGDLTAADTVRDRPEMAKVCVLLAENAYDRQTVDLAERYVTAGLRYVQGQKDDLTIARLYQLRGNCFGLRGDYERARYYLQEALELLSKMDQTGEVLCVLASAYGDMGRFSLCGNDFSKAGPWYRKALALLQDTDCVGQVWLLVHYGRTVFAVDDYPRAKSLFGEAYALAEKTGEHPGRAAAGAYCAYFAMADGDEETAARLLREAMEEEQVLHSPMEGAILNFISMKIRRRLDLDQQDSGLTVLLPDRADDYARRGVRLGNSIPDVFEVQILTKDLRDGISSQLRYRSWELYSKNKRFMSE